MPNSAIYQITKEGFDKVSYKETEHYMLTKSFLNNPERMLKYLFDDEDD
jgi:predicted ATPase